MGYNSATYTKNIDQKQHKTSLLIIRTIVYRIRNPVDLPNEVNKAKIRHMPEDIPNPNNENGLLFILLIIISATIYPAI